MKNIQPLFDQVLLAEDKPSSKTASGIYVEGNLGDSLTYTVLAIGEDVKKVKIGDKTFVKFDASSQIIKIDGKQRVLVPEDKISAIISE